MRALMQDTVTVEAWMDLWRAQARQYPWATMASSLLLPLSSCQPPWATGCC